MPLIAAFAFMEAHVLPFLDWLNRSSGFISVTGALIGFFSWAVTNTLGQRYSRIKSSNETAQSTFRLYAMLNEQRDRLNLLTMEVIQRSEAGLNATRLRAGKSDDRGRNEAQQFYSVERLSANQLKELHEFALETLTMSKAVDKSAHAASISRIQDEIEPLYRRLNELDRDVSEAANDRSVGGGELWTVVNAYVDYFRDVALPRVPDLYRAIIAESNAVRRESEQRLRSAKSMPKSPHAKRSFSTW